MPKLLVIGFEITSLSGWKSRVLPTTGKVFGHGACGDGILFSKILLRCYWVEIKSNKKETL
ncbi:MAG: hypothetical protein HYX35_03680 [Proteobacteria bacterium]|nr:hypothetical protein [Pseudomonadota bacterium]